MNPVVLEGAMRSSRPRLPSLLAAILILGGCAGSSVPAPPEIKVHPANRTARTGSPATFSVQARSASSLTYQWSRNGSVIPGATDATYTTSPVVSADHRSTFHVVVTDAKQQSVESAKALLAVDSATPGYAFVADKFDNTVSTYVVDLATGRLRFLRTTSTGQVPVAVAVAHVDQFLYVANSADATVSQFRISQDGTLTPLATPAVAAGAFPSAMVVDPTSSFLYVTNAGDGSGNGAIRPFAIGNDGSLTPLSGVDVTTGPSPQVVVVHPTGKYLYVGCAAAGNQQIFQYDVGQPGSSVPGAPTPMTPPVSTTMSGLVQLTLTVDPSGEFLLVAGASGPSSSGLWSLSINSTNGTVGSVVSATSPQYGPSSIAFASRNGGNLVYVANKGSGTVSQFTLASNGILGYLQGAIGTGATPSSLVVDPSGSFAFVTDTGDGTVSQYAIGSNGTFTALLPGVAPARKGPVAVAVTGSGPVTATPRYAWVGNAKSSDLSPFTVSSTGALERNGEVFPVAAEAKAIAVDPSGTHVYVALGGLGTSVLVTSQSGGVLRSPGTMVPVGQAPWGLSLDPAGRYAYVVNNGDGTVSQFSVGLDGSLTPLDPATVRVGTNPQAIAIDPSGRQLYVANRGTAPAYADSGISQFAIASSTSAAPGTLTALSPASVVSGKAPVSLAIDPTSTSLYSANQVDGTVQRFAINSAGTLTAGASATAGQQPAWVAIHPSGSFVYVVNGKPDAGHLGNDVSLYTVASGGALVPEWPATIATGLDPAYITFDPAGAFAYVVSQGWNEVYSYAVSATSGRLVPMNPAWVSTGTGPACIALSSTWASP